MDITRARKLYGNKRNRSKKFLKEFKDAILTQLFDSRHIHEKVDGICFRNHIKKDTEISGDIVQETFMHLSNKQPEFIIDLYMDSPDRLIGLGVRIAIWKVVQKNPTYPGYPKHSVAQWILYFSNLSKFSQDKYSDSHEQQENEYDDVMQDNSLAEEMERGMTATEVWDAIKSHLTEDELEMQTQLLSGKRGRGTYSKEMKQRIADFHRRVREIFKEQQLDYKNYNELNG